MFLPVYNRDMAQNISVPDIGDFKDVEVIEILVKPGDHCLLYTSDAADE